MHISDHGPEYPSRVTPPVDIHETDREITIVSEMPGCAKEDITLEIKDDELTVTGARARRAETEGYGTLRAERPHGVYYRKFSMNVPVDTDKITAAYAQGVLTVRIPKSEKVLPRQIAVA